MELESDANDKILTKSSTNQLCNKIIYFDPLRRSFSLSIISFRASIVNYCGSNLKDFKVCVSGSITSNDMRHAKTADAANSVIHDLFIRCFPEKTNQMFLSILPLKSNRISKNVEVMRGVWGNHFIDLDSKFWVTGSSALL
jgi:hypothetical protein